MNKGTDRNVMTQLGISSDEYNLTTAVYYVSIKFTHMHSILFI